MLERETDIILQILTERTISTRNSIPLKEVLSPEVPKGIKAYMQAEVMHWLESDLDRSPRFTRIDRTASATNHLAKIILRTLAQEYVFPREEYLTTLDHAVHFLENYLCRPRWTLEHFIFADASRMPRDTLIPKLDYFYDYSYFGKLIERVAHQKRWNEVHVDDFRLLIAKIDDQIIKEHTPRELAMLAKPIYGFLLLGDQSQDKPIPLKPILVFYEDKNMKTLKDYIERICNIRKRADITLTELVGIIKDLYLEHEESLSSVSSAEEVTPPEPTGETNSYQATTTPHVQTQSKDESRIHEAVPSDVKDTISSQKSDEAAGPIETTGDKTWENQDVRERDDSPTLDSPKSERLGSARSTTMNREKNVPLSLTYAGMKKTNPIPSLPDLYSLISKKEHEQFTKEVFRKDAAYYSGVVAALNKTHTWKEASIFLNQLFQINGLDPFSEHVIQFTDAIHHRYDIDTKHAQ